MPQIRNNELNNITDNELTQFPPLSESSASDNIDTGFMITRRAVETMRQRKDRSWDEDKMPEFYNDYFDLLEIDNHREQAAAANKFVDKHLRARKPISIPNGETKNSNPNNINPVKSCTFL